MNLPMMISLLTTTGVKWSHSVSTRQQHLTVNVCFTYRTEKANRWLFNATLNNSLSIIGYHYRLSTCYFFRLIESATVYICFTVFCLVRLPTSCCVIGVNAHLLRRVSSLTNYILLYFLVPLQSLSSDRFSLGRQW